MTRQLDAKGDRRMTVQLFNFMLRLAASYGVEVVSILMASVVTSSLGCLYLVTRLLPAVRGNSLGLLAALGWSVVNDASTARNQNWYGRIEEQISGNFLTISKFP